MPTQAAPPMEGWEGFLNRFGLPLLILAMIALAVYRAGRFLGPHVVTMVQAHVSGVRAIQASSQTTSEAVVRLDTTMKAINDLLGQNESRASDRHASTIGSFRDALAAHELAEVTRHGNVREFILEQAKETRHATAGSAEKAAAVVIEALDSMEARLLKAYQHEQEEHSDPGGKA